MKKKKSAGTPGKASAKIPPAKAEKPAEGIPAKPEQPSAPLPYPHPSLAPALWVNLADAAERLVSFYRTGVPAPLDYIRLGQAIRDCFRLLIEAARRGDTERSTTSLVGATSLGCEILESMSKDEKSREGLMARASEKPEWPVMLSTKTASWEAAKQYLHYIGVGTRSVPPTAHTKVTKDVRWTELAAMVIEKIKRFQPLLKLKTQGLKSSDLRDQRQNDKWLLEANKYPEIHGLPEKLNAETRETWWKIVAKKMLIDYWEESPKKAEDDFGKVEETAKKSLEKSGTITGKISDEKSRAKLRARCRVIVIHSVREAFYVIAAKQ